MTLHKAVSCSEFRFGRIEVVHAEFHFNTKHGKQKIVPRTLECLDFRALYVEGRDVSERNLVVELAAGNGADREALSAALAGAVLKARLKAECDAAFGKGVFGSPYMIVDGEPFFGVDRLPQIERWLSSGGF